MVRILNVPWIIDADKCGQKIPNQFHHRIITARKWHAALQILNGIPIRSILINDTLLFLTTDCQTRRRVFTAGIDAHVTHGLIIQISQFFPSGIGICGFGITLHFFIPCILVKNLGS